MKKKKLNIYFDENHQTHHLQPFHANAPFFIAIGKKVLRVGQIGKMQIYKTE